MLFRSRLVFEVQIRPRGAPVPQGLKPYFLSAVPVRRAIIETGVVGDHVTEGESDEVAVGRSGSHLIERFHSATKTRKFGVGGVAGLGGLAGGLLPIGGALGFLTHRVPHRRSKSSPPPRSCAPTSYRLAGGLQSVAWSVANGSPWSSPTVARRPASEYPFLLEVLDATRNRLFRSITTSGLRLDAALEVLTAAAPEEVHVSIHHPEDAAEVERVAREVKSLEARGIRAGAVARPYWPPDPKNQGCITRGGSAPLGPDRLGFRGYGFTYLFIPERVSRSPGWLAERGPVRRLQWPPPRSPSVAFAG